MSDVAWEMEHSVEAEVSALIAWEFWTNVQNWSDPPAEFELNGPFAAGSRGITRMPGQPPIQWLIREVNAPETAAIETSLNGATLTFEWRFHGVAQNRARLTQRIVLSGDNALAFVSQIQSMFGPTLSDGMSKIAAAIAEYGARAERNRRE